MGNWRTDVWIKKNDDNGEEITTAKYNYIGRGKGFSFQPQNNWKTVSGMGSKFIQIQSAGKYEVSGSLKTYLDYNNFYHLIGAFEEYDVEKIEIAGTTVYHHSYKKSNLRRIPSFTMIARKLNRKVGGGYDETTKFERVYFKGITLTWESGNPLVSVSYNWVATYNDTEFKDCPEGLDFADAEALNKEQQVEWGCLSYSDDGVNFTPIATNEKTKMSFSTTLGTIGKCGARFATDFSEQGTTEVTTESSVYSRDGHWLRRLYSGGKFDGDIDAEASIAPYAKGLKPIPYMRISSFENEKIDDSTHRVIVTLQNVMVKSLTQNYDSTSAITDSPTLASSRVWMDIYTPDVDKNVYTGTAPGGTDLVVSAPSENFRQVDDPEISIEGMTETGATIEIDVNGTKYTPAVGTDLKFVQLATVSEGDVSITVKASKSGEGYTTIFREGKFVRHPALTIDTPTEGQVVSGDFEVKGQTDIDDKTEVYVQLNDGTPVKATKTGTQYSLMLTPTVTGNNSVKVTAKRTSVGEAMETEDIITVVYTP